MNRGYLANPSEHRKLRKKISPELRARILRRDNSRCQHPECKSGYVPFFRLELHHLDSDPANNEPANLTTVCHRCNMIAKGQHLAAMRRMRKLYKSLTDYHTNQTSFDFAG